MARREYHVNLPCAYEGCRERSFFVVTSRREEQRTRSDYADRGWRCTRHRRPEEVLSVDNLERVTVLTAGPSERYSDLDGRYWNGEGGGSGFEYGPGFKAYAGDFLPGTRLVVTARIELPENGDTQ
ncbi:hypothetical protein [Nocardia sp. NPDC003963]